MKRSRLRRSALVATLVIALSAVTVACSSGDADNDGDGSTSKETLTLGIMTDALGFSPFDLRNGVYSVIPSLYDYLFRMAPDGSLKPQFATGYEFNSDHSAVEVTLHEGATFHSGSPVDAAAVAASVKFGQTAKPTPNALMLQIKTTKVNDPTKITLGFGKPVSANFAESILSQTPLVDVPAAGDLTHAAAGGGPFELVKHTTGQLIELKAFDDYWDKDVSSVSKVELKIFADEQSATAALETGDLDGIYGASTTAAARFKKMDYGVLPSPGPNVVELQINPTRAPFTNKLVRQAMFYIIPRDQICEVAFNGLCKPAPLGFVPGSQGYSQEWADKLAFDPKKARQLLDESGLSDAQLEDWKLLVPQNRPANQALAEVVQQELSKIGVDIKIDLQETSVAGGNIIAGNFAMTSTNLGGTAAWPGSFTSNRSMKLVDNKVLGDVTKTAPEYYEAMTDLQNAISDEDQEKAVEALRQSFYDVAWNIGCCTNQSNLTIMSPKLSGIELTMRSMLDLRAAKLG